MKTRNKHSIAENSYNRPDRKKTSSFFNAHTDHNGHIQTNNIIINIEPPKEDCLGSCFAALAKCFKK